jgi:hypothetical protein
MYMKGRWGLIDYLIKKCFLRMLPQVAVELLTYHCALICKREPQQ